jgi:hypothetical protein
VGRDSFDVGVGVDFGWVLKVTIETTTYQEVCIQLSCWSQGLPHAKAN